MTTIDCASCGVEFDNGGLAWKKICGRCYAISKSGQPKTEQSTFRPAAKLVVGTGAPEPIKKEDIYAMWKDCLIYARDTLLANANPAVNGAAMHIDFQPADIVAATATLFIQRCRNEL